VTLKFVSNKFLFFRQIDSIISLCLGTWWIIVNSASASECTKTRETGNVVKGRVLLQIAANTQRVWCTQVDFIYFILKINQTCDIRTYIVT
jgi:hypothetical protein